MLAMDPPGGDEGWALLILGGAVVLAVARLLGWTRYVPGLDDLIWPGSESDRDVDDAAGR
jgi:hypothetical protein